MVDDPGARFENAVAVSLLRAVSRWNELGLGDFDVRYIRNTQKQEVDFLLVNGKNPVALFEAKLSDDSLSAAGNLFAETLKIPYYHIVATGDSIEAFDKQRFIVPAWRFLPILG
jgi:predicted AAA+ superfamily ATPase